MSSVSVKLSPPREKLVKENIGKYVKFLMAVAICLTVVVPTLVLLIIDWMKEDYQKPCSHDFFCNPKYLYALGNSGAFADSKEIVDLVMKNDFKTFKAEFDKRLFNEDTLKNATKIRLLIEEYFDEPGKELEEKIPEDWVEDPFPDQIKDSDLKKFSLILNSLWKNLTRKEKDMSNSRSTFLHMPYESVVPGGRFRETYYWDNYWTIEGLLACKMNSTVKKMIQNMLYSVSVYGFVPNGGRVYYTTRSQPPFLTIMMSKYFDDTEDIEFLKESLPLLEKEYAFWLENRQVVVKDNRKLFQYKTNMSYERPESFIEDYNTAKMASEIMGRRKEQVHKDLASAAESGWDFSSRWLAYSGPHSGRLYSIRTTQIVPVCLNSLLCRVARHLKSFNERLGLNTQAKFYENEVNRIQSAIEDFLWDKERLSWFDYDLEQNAHHRRMYVSNYYPLWADCHSRTSEELSSILKSLKDSGYIDFTGGFASSSVYSRQQWDFPNAWAPLQDIMIEVLDNLGEEGKKSARNLAQKWIYNVYDTFKRTNNVYEKYSATRIGYPGEGGEYDVQVGFGWTNGVVLKYLIKYGDQLTTESSNCAKESQLENNATVIVDPIN